MPTISPSYMMAIRSPRARTSSSSLETTMTATPVVADLDDLAVHVLDRADVETACRLRADEHLEWARELARDDDLLLVASRERADQRVAARCADVELLERRAPLSWIALALLVPQLENGALALHG